MEFSTIVFWFLLLGAVMYVISIYNTLVTLKNRFKNAFSQIEVQLKRRYDLIPNLVETAKGYQPRGVPVGRLLPAVKTAPAQGHGVCCGI